MQCYLDRALCARRRPNPNAPVSDTRQCHDIPVYRHSDWQAARAKATDCCWISATR